MSTLDADGIRSVSTAAIVGLAVALGIGLMVGVERSAARATVIAAPPPA